MKNFKDKVVVITGAASGIGQALVLKFAGAGARLALADIEIEGLKTTLSMSREINPGLQSLICRLNVAQAGDFAKFAETVSGRFGGADVLINNAGVSHFGSFVQTGLEDIEWIFGVNYWGVVNGCRSFLPLLLQQKEAALVNISSAFGLIGMRTQSAYCATKFAVRGMTESLRQELAGGPVSVICVHPGGIRTNIARNARLVGARDGESERKRDRYIAYFERIARTSAADAADHILNGIIKNRPRILIGRDAKIASLAQRLFPGSYEKILSRLL
ncbi:MAG TPA: SDR family NAD(P)-dependent oxidoreductase [Spirochaetota bacterium]|nr:SDR family NAD(P)-dependent oxidoreductase [Spirochaetota bacterium]